MKGHKRYRAGAWRLVVAAGNDPLTGRRRSVFETVRAPNNRAGSKVADARLAELITAPGDETARGGYQHKGRRLSTPNAFAPRRRSTPPEVERCDRHGRALTRRTLVV
ncbi:MAG: hypothetical protein ACYCS7_00890 [Acidimicrobiales bacterium]